MAQFCPQQAREFFEAAFVALVEDPLLDAFAVDESGLAEDSQVLAGSRLADAQFFGDENAADAVGDEITVDLGPEVFYGVFEPVEDFETAFVGECAKSELHIHI
jgi:hypothetical protein